MRLQAALRNPDEFYFKMVHGRARDGKAELAAEGRAEVDQVEYARLLKAQNAGLVRLQEAVARKSRARLQEGLHLVWEDKPNSIEVLVDSEREVREFDLAAYYDTYPEMLAHKSNIPTRAQLEGQSLAWEPDAGAVKEGYKQLLDELGREQQLRQVSNRLDYERSILSKDRRKTVLETEEGVRRHIFLRQRKR
jgi:U3 small nucleolar RNA-associated protein 11